MGENYTELERKLKLAVEEIEQCRVDLFEALDKFHVLSFYINDEQALECAKLRVQWMAKADDRASETLKEIKSK